jgi:hypothetical protein
MKIFSKTKYFYKNVTTYPSNIRVYKNTKMIPNAIEKVNNLEHKYALIIIKTILIPA